MVMTGTCIVLYFYLSRVDTDVLGYVQEAYKVIKSVYGDRRVIEKSLKIAVGASHDRVRI